MLTRGKAKLLGNSMSSPSDSSKPSILARARLSPTWNNMAPDDQLEHTPAPHTSQLGTPSQKVERPTKEFFGPTYSRPKEESYDDAFHAESSLGAVGGRDVSMRKERGSERRRLPADPRAGCGRTMGGVFQFWKPRY